MNSIERREARYQRRKAKRLRKEKDLTDSLGSFDEVFSYQNLYDAFALCKKGVRWKASIQSYETNLCINTYEIYEKLQNGTWKSRGFTKVQTFRTRKSQTDSKRSYIRTMHTKDLMR